MDQDTRQAVKRAPSPRRRAAVSRGDRQRQLIIDSLEQVLATAPSRKFSVKDITEVAGINRPNFYFYFESKDDVLGELVTAALKGWESKAGGFLRRTGESHINYFQRLDDAAFETWASHDNVMIAGLQSANSEMSSRNRWTTFVEEYNTQVAGQLTRDVEAGLVTPYSDDHFEMMVLLTDMATFSYYQDRLLNPSAEHTARMRENIKRIWLGSWGISVSSVA